MSKESSYALKCPGGCGQRIVFLKEHAPHCTGRNAQVLREVLRKAS